jgi:hypothetical protein
MKAAVDIEIINRVIDNSVWISPESSNTFKFAKGRELIINDKNNLNYTLSTIDNKIVMQLGTNKRYYIDYVDDFTLCLYNGSEKFRIVPE